MHSKELLGSALQISHQMVWPLLQDLQSASLVTSMAGCGNHAHWILGHLTVSEGRMFSEMMRGLPNPVEPWKEFFGSKTQPRPDAAGYPSYDELLSKLTELRGQTLELLESLDESDLDQVSKNVPPGFEPFFGTWRQCFLVQAMHWMNHRGQLADCRRAAGRSPMMA